MRTETNELDIHSLQAKDIDRLRETGKTMKCPNLSRGYFLRIALRKLLEMKDHSNNETM